LLSFFTRFPYFSFDKMAPKLKRTASSLSRKSLHRLDTSASTASRRNSSNVKIQEENENSLNEVLEEESNDNEDEDEDEDEQNNSSSSNNKRDDDTVSVNSFEREMTLKDRQEVRLLIYCDKRI
jgi:hypothetical protein